MKVPADCEMWVAALNEAIGNVEIKNCKLVHGRFCGAQSNRDDAFVDLLKDTINSQNTWSCCGSSPRRIFTSPAIFSTSRSMLSAEVRETLV